MDANFKQSATSMKKSRKYLWLLLFIPALLILGFFVWALTPSGPMPEALVAMQSDQKVEVTSKPWIIFQPKDADPIAGLIIYPGGRIDPRSYAPQARAIAEEGNLVIITPMPLNLAVFSPEKAAEVIQAHPEISHWIISGHSLGGAMAARFILNNPGEIQGLGLWAAYPASSDNLSGYPIIVSSIFATLDGLATPDKIAASRPLLPETTNLVAIIGGNHAQFAWYGNQPGDNPAKISREEQQAQIVEATLELMRAILNLDD